MYNTMHHWGCVVVPPGYTDGSVHASGGNPYGTAHASDSGMPSDEALEAARHQGHRLATFATAIRGVRVEIGAA